MWQHYFRYFQTFYVGVLRLICEHTIEENILKKANEKRILGDIAIEGGNFNTAFFKKVNNASICCCCLSVVDVRRRSFGNVCAISSPTFFILPSAAPSLLTVGRSSR